MRYAYPADILEETDGVTITFPDVPEAIAAGGSRAAALATAGDALVSGLSFYVDDGRPLPRPSARRDRPLVALPSLEAAKLALSFAMQSANIGNTELARRLNIDEKAVRRLRDLLHESKIAQVEAALRELGKQIEISILEIA